MTTLTAKPTALDSFIAKAGEFDVLLQRLHSLMVRISKTPGAPSCFSVLLPAQLELAVRTKML